MTVGNALHALNVSIILGQHEVLFMIAQCLDFIRLLLRTLLKHMEINQKAPFGISLSKDTRTPLLALKTSPRSLASSHQILGRVSLSIVIILSSKLLLRSIRSVFLFFRTLLLTCSNAILDRGRRKSKRSPAANMKCIQSVGREDQRLHLRTRSIGQPWVTMTKLSGLGPKSLCVARICKTAFNDSG